VPIPAIPEEGCVEATSPNKCCLVPEADYIGRGGPGGGSYQWLVSNEKK